LKTNIILIDFENVQPKDLTPLRGRPCKIKVFCGANQTKIPTSLVTALLPIGPDAELVLIQGSGKNALDFHIAYYIGRLSTESPGAVFTSFPTTPDSIRSSDTSRPRTLPATACHPSATSQGSRHRRQPHSRTAPRKLPTTFSAEKTQGPAGAKLF